MKKILEYVFASALLAVILCYGTAKADVIASRGGWTLDDTGVLIIENSQAWGEWDEYKASVESVFFTDGAVSYLFDSAFMEYPILTSVRLPNGLTSIGTKAFFNCDSLTSITVPASLRYINSQAFRGCSKLNEIHFSELESIMTMGKISYSDSASHPFCVTKLPCHYYANDMEITSVSIPYGVTSIGDYAFYKGSSLTSITISNSVISIGDYAFCDCRGLTNFMIPNGVTGIGSGAFSGCSSLTSITIPNGVTSIGDTAFSNCSGLTSITISNSVISIGDYAFSYCRGLTSFMIPNGVTSIGSGTFMGCSSLTSIAIPNGVTSIGAHAFNGCQGVESVWLPDSITSIGEYAFLGCGKINEIYFSSVLSWLSINYIGDYSHPNCSSSSCHVFVDNVEVKNLEIPNGLNSIGNQYFKGCVGLESITIPNSVTGIGSYAFSDCSGLTSVVIPNSVTRINDFAFYNCSGLRSISVSDSVTDILASAFSGCSNLTNVTLGCHVTSIGPNSFGDCPNLERIWWPTFDDVTIYNKAFGYSNPTIYCYEFSVLEQKAIEQGLRVSLIDEFNTDDDIQISVTDCWEIEMSSSRYIPYSIFPDISGIDISFACEDLSVGTVTNKGLFTAITLGATSITITANNTSRTFQVNVIKPLIHVISFAIPDVWVVVRQTQQAIITDLIPDDADINILWNIDNATYATVDVDGFITGVSLGETTFTATDSISGQSATAMVHICYPVTAVSFENTDITLAPGDDLQLVVNVVMRTQSCQNHLVIFSSSDEAIATVDEENGLVHGLSSGRVTITATAVNDDSITDVCTVTVRGPNTLTLPESLISIESEAFAELPNVDAIRIPDSVTSIAEDAFDSDMILIMPMNSIWWQWAEDNGYIATEE